MAAGRASQTLPGYVTRFGMRARNQLYSFRHESTNELTIPLFGAVLRRRFDAQMLSAFRARRNTFSRRECT